MPVEFRPWVSEVVSAIEETYKIRSCFVSQRSEIGDFAYDFGNPSSEELKKIESILGIKLKSMNLCEIAADLVKQDSGLSLQLQGE